MSGINVAVVGLGFGEAFVPIYRAHPDVNEVVLVDTDGARRAAVARRYGLPPGYDAFERVLDDTSVDAVHVCTPVAFHADMVAAGLAAGKHTASAVPMGVTLEDLDRLVVAQERSGRNYMMMETSVYGREYRYTHGVYTAGLFGPLTLYRGVHIQNLDGFPPYWQGYPPMHYITHALSPLLGLLDTAVASVQCQGAGTLTPDRTIGRFDNRFPTEVGLFRLHGSDVLAEVTMSFFQTARSYIEGFALYGERLGVEWPVDNRGPLTRYDMTGPAPGRRGNQVTARSVEPPDDDAGLPPALREFVRPSRIQLPGMPEPVAIGAAHGGSHPFLVDEFVRSIVEGRAAAIDARTAAAWTAPGICAHQSALAGGSEVRVPDYRTSLSGRPAPAPTST